MIKRKKCDMLRFKSFLNEVKSTYGVASRENDPIGRILESPGMLRAIKNASVLYRSMSDSLKHGASIIDSAGTQRYSVATNNIYQMMMDASPALADFPSRTRSIICSTNTKSLSLYGQNAYIILPFDNTPLAVSRTSDFISQEIHALDNIGLDIFSMGIGFILSDLGIKPDAKTKYIDIKKLDKQLEDASITEEQWNDISKNHKGEIANIIFLTIRKLYKKNKSNVFKTLAAQIMTPNSLDLSLVRAGAIIPDNKGKEVWFEGKALALTPLTFINIVKELEDMGNEISPDIQLQNISRLVS